MVEIKKGTERATVTAGAFHAIFKPQGWEVIESPAEESDNENADAEKPLDKMTANELREKAAASGYEPDTLKAMPKAELLALLQE